MRQVVICGTAWLAMLFAAVSAPAQHTLAAKFDLTKPLTLTGTVTQIDWANPYVHVLMKVAGQPLPAQKLDVFPDAIEDHNRVVIRVSDQGQNSRYNRERYRLIGQRKRAYSDQGIVENRDYGCYSVDPLKPECQVNQHSCQ